jgi:hypothetical protein
VACHANVAGLDSTASVCSGTCATDPISYFLEKYENSKTLTPIGLAKDGRVIYGPYDSSGNLWDITVVDACGGLKIEDVYSYVLTTYHPYAVGCFGPATVPQ